MHIARDKHGTMFIVGYSGSIGWRNKAPYSLARASYDDQGFKTLLDKGKTHQLMNKIFMILEGELDGKH